MWDGPVSLCSIFTAQSVFCSLCLCFKFRCSLVFMERSRMWADLHTVQKCGYLCVLGHVFILGWSNLK